MKTLFNKLCALMGIFLFLVTPVAMAQEVSDEDEVTLDKLPLPFLDENRVYNEKTAIVVGDDAAASDTLAAIDIATTLANQAKMKLDSEVDEEPGVLDIKGVKEEGFLGIPLNVMFGILTDNDLSFLKDDYIKYDSERIDFKETIEFTDRAKTVFSETDDKELEAKIGLEFGVDSIVYKFVFEDELVMDEDEAEITWLGKDLEITDIGNDEVTVRTSNKFVLEVGKVARVNGNEVTLINVGSDGSVIVSVKDSEGATEQEIITKDQSEKVNGVEISVLATFQEETKEERQAVLYVGESITKELSDDECIVELEDDEVCKWAYSIQTSYDINNTNYYFAEGDFLGIKFDDKINDYEEFLLEGDSITIPNADGEVFAKIKLVGTNEPSYLKVTIEDEGNNIYELSGSDSESFIFGSEEYKKVFLDMTTTQFFEDYELTTVIGDAATELVLDDSELSLTTGLVIEDPSNNTILEVFNLSKSREEEVLNSYGIVYYNSEEWNENQDELTLEIPEEQLEASIIVGRVSDGSEDYSGYIDADITVDTMLASEVVGFGAYSLIIVGGPCSDRVNHQYLTEKIFNLRCEDWELESGKALIEISEDGKNVLIAGTDAIDTRKATKIFAESLTNNEKLTGTKTILDL